MSKLSQSAHRNEKLIIGGNSVVEVYNVFPGRLEFVKTILSGFEWGIGSMLVLNNKDLFLMNGDNDKICKYRFFNEKTEDVELLFESTQKFSWPLLKCFCVYNDNFGSCFLVGIFNEDNFKHILIEKVFDKRVTGDFQVFKKIHKKTISNIIYNPIFNYFVSGGRDCSIQFWKIHSDRVYGHKSNGLI